MNDIRHDPYLVLYLPLYKLDGGSFMSRDAYGHLCTVTGALWRPDGRYFDGTDDEIDLGNPSVLDFTDDFTIIAWFKLDVTGVTRYMLISKDTDADRGWTLSIDFASDSAVGVTFEIGGGVARCLGTTDLTGKTGIWYQAGVTRIGNDYIVYLDASSDGTVTSSQSITSVSNVYIGRRDHSAAKNYYEGIIGEVSVYSRGITPIEIQNNLVATKWRYR